MREITLTRGYVALVDDEDFDWLSQFCWRAVMKRAGVYAARRFPRAERARRGVASITMHREILGAPAGVLVDHRDLNTLNNQRHNLRLCTSWDSACNRPARRDGLVPYKGVFSNKSGTFGARIERRGKRHYIGTFATAQQAALAYDAAAADLFGEFAWLNREHFDELATLAKRAA